MSIIETAITVLRNVANFNSSEKFDRQQAKLAFVARIKKANLPYEAECAAIANASTIVECYANQSSIVNYALQEMRSFDERELTKSDSDWISHFMDGARKVSDPEMQKLWGKVLAGEFENHGTAPPRIIHVLSNLTRFDAALLQLLLNFDVIIAYYSNEETILDRKIIINWDTMSTKLLPTGLSFEKLLEFDSCGLLHYSPFCFSIKVSQTKPVFISYAGQAVMVPLPQDGKMSIGNVLLSESGSYLLKTLSPVIAPKAKALGYFPDMLELWPSAQEIPYEDAVQIYPELSRLFSDVD